MKYTLIKGSYHVVSQSPDADSVKFHADNPALWDRINTENREPFERNLKENAGVVQLRLEGIDALETHYSAIPLPTPAELKGLVNPALAAPKPVELKQPAEMGMRSTAALLAFIGVTDAKWRTFGATRYISEARITTDEGSAVVKEKLKDKIPGYIVTGDVEMNGRPLAWVFTDTTEIPDGTTVSTAELASIVDESANYHLLKTGMVYPLYFMTLAGKLRQRLSDATREAQAVAMQTVTVSATTASNIWQMDASVPGIQLTSLRVLTDEKALYPYLFRKVVKHHYKRQMEAYWAALQTGANTLPDLSAPNLDGFFQGANPYVFVISDQDFVRLSDVVEAHGTTIRMHRSPSDLVFLSG